MKDCRTHKSEKFKIILGFSVNNAFNTKEQIVLRAIMDAFEGKNIQTQYWTLK